MRHLLLAICFLSVSVFAAISDKNRRILNTMMNEPGRKTQLGTLIDEGGSASLAKDGVQASKVVRSTYDVAVDGGTIASHDLGENIPANAIIKKAYYQVTTQFVDAGSGTVAIQCATAGDIRAAADLTGSSAGAILDGVPTGSAATMVDVGASECDITAVVAGAAQTAGKLVLWVEYVNTDAN